MRNQNELTRGEEEIMQILWRLGNGTINDVIELMAEPKPKYTTVATFFKILEYKGFIAREARGRGFLYTPTVAGSFLFSSDTESAVIGYYGAPHFVQDVSAAEVENNSFSMSIRASMIGGAATVIGIDADANTEGCILTVQRTGDPEWSIEDEPWTVYEPTINLKPYTMGSGTICEFDLSASTDTYKLVLDSNGYYHLDSENGPLVLVRLTKDPKYLPCFKNILDRSGVNRYFFDANGEFVKKETYDQCLFSYIECAEEENGTYPLTEDLKYIIQQRGEYAGWWDLNGSYLFVDENNVPDNTINTEIAWLFMCCYLEN